jgi:anti-sigma B factor antagonist
MYRLSEKTTTYPGEFIIGQMSSQPYPDHFVDIYHCATKRRYRMPQANIVMNVRRVNVTTSIIDIQGEISAFAENVLMQAYTEASTPTTRSIILNFSGLEYMNSSGIGLLVTLLIRVNRQKQRLLSYGLSEHYQHIFEITRLSEAIGIYDTEEQALAAA